MSKTSNTILCQKADSFDDPEVLNTVENFVEDIEGTLPITNLFFTKYHTIIIL